MSKLIHFLTVSFSLVFLISCSSAMKKRDFDKLTDKKYYLTELTFSVFPIQNSEWDSDSFRKKCFRSNPYKEIVNTLNREYGIAADINEINSVDLRNLDIENESSSGNTISWISDKSYENYVKISYFIHEKKLENNSIGFNVYLMIKMFHPERNHTVSITLPSKKTSYMDKNEIQKIMNSLPNHLLQYISSQE